MHSTMIYCMTLLYSRRKVKKPYFFATLFSGKITYTHVGFLKKAISSSEGANDRRKRPLIAEESCVAAPIRGREKGYFGTVRKAPLVPFAEACYQVVP